MRLYTTVHTYGSLSSLDLPGNHLMGPRIIGNHIGDLEREGIVADNVVLNCHLQGRTNNGPDTGDGAASLSILVEFDKPPFGAQELKAPDHSESTVLLTYAASAIPS